MKKIKLTQNKYAIVDNKDYSYLSQFNWQYDGFYAGRNIRIKDKKNRIRMHTELMSPNKGFVIDHIDGNRLNNRRNNLRICTQSDNQKRMKKFSTNKSGYSNIHWDSSRNKWSVQKCINGKRKSIGRFDKLTDAKKSLNAFYEQLT